MLAAARDYDLALFAHPDPICRRCGRHSPAPPRVGGRAILLIIFGPESGFTDGEARQARAAGAQAVSLGPRILRTETAAMVMAAQILFALEQPSVR